MRNQLNRRFGMNVTYDRTWYGKEIANNELHVNIFPIPNLGMPRPELNDILIKPPTMRKRAGRKKKRRIPSRGVAWTFKV
ncbi:hypothetical protein QJS04_geneDACA000903 [Acorus gramineus]|uniref:Uncharacterized protein n=1 Tax=Acorus gramineus TaxID=55184 RepID=A0AAV9AF50_ACOGR|nr:hypothetical protein QJS04_geneDACA000903 [Acorus gramineus]